MAASYACGPCKIRTKATPAEYWCHDCDDLLCEVCNSHHGVNKMCRNHTVMNIDNYKKLPEPIRIVSSLCPDHGLKYFHFCKSHSALCCPACISGSHKSCTDLQLLDDVIKTTKTSSFIGEVEASMNDIKSNLERIISERADNISGLRKQKQEIKEKIGAIREEINQHIDALEEKIQNELTSIEESEIRKLQQSKADLTASLDMIKNKLEETTIFNQYASDLLIFLGIRESEKVIEKEKSCIENLLKDGSLSIRELQCNINDDIQAILSNIASFGSISVISKPSTIRLASDKDKQAQIFLSTPQSKRSKFGNTTVKLNSEFNIQRSQTTELRGCSIFPNGKVVIANEGTKRVIVLTESGKVEKEILIRGGGPWDVTVIDYESIAVSTNKGVQIIDANSGSIDKKFDVGWCYGVSYNSGVLYCCVRNAGVISIEVSTGKSETIVHDKHFNLSCCAVAEGHLYYTRSDKKGLQCYSIKGEKMWEQEDTALVDLPVGVAADGSGNIFLASYNNNQILAISPDGLKCRQMLSANDGVKEPWGLCYDENKNELCVACVRGQCFHFKID